MNIAGIIAEYNPFHNGHAYHISEVKKRTDAEYIITIISGDFVQRGAPAIADKYARAKMALLGGADLVAELPVCAATASAETFARTGVNILAQSGIVTHLGFGCETDDLSILTAIADLFTEEPESFKKALSSYIKEGMSFPAARAKAAENHLGNLSHILEDPNNILAIEYLKALKRSGASLVPCAIQRKGAGYHSIDAADDYSSATAIRKLINTCNEPSCQTSRSHIHAAAQQESKLNMDILLKQMPPACADELLTWLQKYPPMTENDFSALLHYKLFLDINNSSNADSVPNIADGFSNCYNEKSELENRIDNLLEHYISFSDFVQLLKTKDRTYTAISRHLLHILLDIRTKHMDILKEINYAPYIRILGFKKYAAPLLTELKKSTIPVIMRVSEDETYLNPKQKFLLDADIRSAHIYNAVLTEKTGNILKNEYRHPLVYL